MSPSWTSLSGAGMMQSMAKAEEDDRTPAPRWAYVMEERSTCGSCGRQIEQGTRVLLDSGQRYCEDKACGMRIWKAAEDEDFKRWSQAQLDK